MCVSLFLQWFVAQGCVCHHVSVCASIWFVCALLPGCVAGVCQGEVADPQEVHGAQGPKGAVQGMTPLHPDQTGRPFITERRSDL